MDEEGKEDVEGIKKSPIRELRLMMVTKTNPRIHVVIRLLPSATDARDGSRSLVSEKKELEVFPVAFLRHGQNNEEHIKRKRSIKVDPCCKCVFEKRGEVLKRTNL